MLPDINILTDIVRSAAREELLPRFAQVQRQFKHDGSVVTEVDLAMQARMQSSLAQHWPTYDFLGEEMSRQEQEILARQTGEGLWCLDPLDGTSNYAAGIPFFSVSLALLIDGLPQIGVVYDPIRDECFTARRGHGASLNGQALGQTAPLELPVRACIGVVDFKRLKAGLAAKLGAEPPYGSQRSFGSSALDWCWLADERFHMYLHGGQKPWDYAAGSLVLAEAGGRATTLEGEDIFSPGLKTRSVVAARNPALFEFWLNWLRQQG